jgi:hypothetical protein
METAHLAITNRLGSRLVPLALLSTLALSLTGCRAIGFIFRTGVWFGVIVVLLIGLLAMGAVKLFRGGRA